MNAHWNSYLNRRLSRRELLRVSSTGFGGMALAAHAGRTRRTRPRLARARPVRWPSSRRIFLPKAKRVIFLFMHGGPSQVDTFDYKPLLTRDHGKPLPFKRPKVVSSETFNLLKSPWEFKQHGQSGMWVSELFPELSRHVDDICFIKSMWGSNSRHGGALLELHTGSDTFVRPSMGSWITYGLGTENQSMPGFITICPTQSHGGANNYSSGFLPGALRGHSHRVRGSSRARCQDSVHCEHRDPARRATHGARLPAGAESRATGGDRSGCRRSTDASNRSSWPSACNRKRRGCRTSPANRPQR